MQSQEPLYYQESIDFRRYIAITWKWLWLIAVGTVVAALTAFIVSSLMKPVYAAKAGVAVVRSGTEVSFEPRFTTISEDDLPATAEARRNALAALVENGTIAGEVFEAFEDRLQPDIESAGALLAHISGALVQRSELIEITAEMHDPALATAIANAWATSYEGLINATYGTTVPDNLMPAIKDQMAESKAAYEEAQAVLAAFLAENRVDELQGQIAEKQSAIRRLQTVLDVQVQTNLGRLTDLYDTRRQSERLLADVNAMQAQVDAGGAGAAVSNSLALALLKAEAFAFSVDFPEQLQLQLGVASDPGVGSELQSLDLAALASTLQNRLDELDDDIAALSAELSVESVLGLEREGVTRAIKELESDVRQLQSQLEIEVANSRELTAERDLAWGTYLTLANKVEEVNVASAVIGTEVRFVSPAMEPRSKVRPQRLKNTALAGVVGFMLALGVVFLIEYLRSAPESAHPAAKGV